ncbi:hypothetical protein QBC39DRAFT_254572 [Podospora conica]|nr:hypothetical protein QBC39DRAFT_254572 [Schizothecium conicum]
MAEPSPPAQFIPRFRTDVYPYIAPSKFRGSLKDKVTIITGAVGVIGKGLAESFAVAGAKLILTYNNTPPPPDFSARCLELGATSVEFVKCNVASLEGCEELVNQTITTHGTIDILINNAGANGLGPFDAQPPQSFISDLSINLHGPYYLMRLCLPHLRPSSGCILNIASRAGTVPVPYSASYCASKAALIHLTACVQSEMDAEGCGVHLYALHPGGIKSAMTVKKYSPESVQSIPGEATREKFARALEIYNDSPYLNGMVCVALATGVGRDALRGRYVDVGQDLEDVLAQGEALRADKELNVLATRFLGGLANAGVPPGGYRVEERFEFPGF